MCTVDWIVVSIKQTGNGYITQQITCMYSLTSIRIMRFKLLPPSFSVPLWSATVIIIRVTVERMQIAAQQQHRHGIHQTRKCFLKKFDDMEIEANRAHSKSPLC